MEVVHGEKQAGVGSVNGEDGLERRDTKAPRELREQRRIHRKTASSASDLCGETERRDLTPLESTRGALFVSVRSEASSGSQRPNFVAVQLTCPDLPRPTSDTRRRNRMSHGDTICRLPPRARAG